MLSGWLAFLSKLPVHAGEQLTRLLGSLLAQQQPHLQQLTLQQLGALKVQSCRAAASADALQKLLTQPPQHQLPQQVNPTSSTQQQQQPGSIAAGDQPPQDDQQQQLPPLGLPQEYTLPDGTKLTVSTEGAQTAEALFRPAAALGAPTPSLIDCIVDCVNELPDQQLRRSALDGVLLSGGGACMPGLHERVVQDLRAQLPTGLAPKLSYLPEYMLQPTPQYTAWLGGAIMAKMVAYNSHFMIKAEYEEIGPSAVHRKCA